MYNQENFSFEIHAEKIIVFVVKITPKDGLISKSILTSVPLPKRGAKSGPWEESLNKLFTAKGGKFKISTQCTGEIWHLFLAMWPNSKYLLRLS